MTGGSFSSYNTIDRSPLETRPKQPSLHLQFRPIRVESSSGDAVNTMAQSDKGIPSSYQIQIRDMNLASTHPATLTGW